MNLKLINKFLQLLFIRLTLVRIKGIKEWYSIQFWILPFTGWNNNFIYIGKQKMLRISKIKLISK